MVKTNLIKLQKRNKSASTKFRGVSNHTQTEIKYAFCKTSALEMKWTCYPVERMRICTSKRWKWNPRTLKCGEKLRKTFLSSHLSYTASLHWLHFDLTPGSWLVYFKSVRDDIRQDECDDTIDKKKIKPLALTLMNKRPKLGHLTTLLN